MDSNSAFYQCDCHVAYEGSTCQTLKSHCSPNPCVGDGVNTSPHPCSLDLQEIAQLGNGPFFTCSCPDTHRGSLCKVDFNECNPNPCNNNGVCTQEVPPVNFPYFSCTCAPGFEGVECDVDIDECATECLKNLNP